MKGYLHITQWLFEAITVALIATCLAVAIPNDARADGSYETAPGIVTQASGYGIVYELNGGMQAKGQVLSIKKGRMFKTSSLKTPTRVRYKFLGWYKDKALTKRANMLRGAANPAKRTVYAKWRLVRYSILYNTNGGFFKGTHLKTIRKGKTVKVSKLAKPIRYGYAFAGWYANGTLTKRANVLRGAANPAKRTVYAKWRTKTYSMTYVPNGGEMPVRFRTAYRTASGAADLPEPVRKGYSFIGWFSDPGFTSVVTGISAGEYGDKTLYAKWERRTAVAHRGYFAEGAAQNSLEAYRAAAEKGFAYAEADVRFTADSRAVLAHDKHKSVYAKGSDGKRVGAPFNLVVSSVTLEQLQNDYIATTPSGISIESLGRADGEGTVRYRNVTEFEELLDACKELGLIACVELKEGTREQVESLVAAVDTRGMTESVRWMSFTGELLKYVQALHPQSRFGVLAEKVTDAKLKSAQLLAAGGGEVEIDVRATQLTQKHVAKCRSAGMPLGVWSLVDEREIASYPQFVSSFMLNALDAAHVPEVL